MWVRAVVAALIVCVPIVFLVTGCRDAAPAPLPPDHPANPRAAEAPAPPPSQTLCDVQAERADRG